MKVIKMYQKVTDWLLNLKDPSLLFFRLVLAYGFYGPAMMKWNNIENVAEWFGSMGIPMPTLNAYLAASTEVAGVVLLSLGLATRIISIPLIIVMLVAFATVHLGNGFEAGDNGFEIPLYYILMLFTLLVNGAGKISIDNLISKKLS
jgi:putative oxidoreductase